MGSDATQPFVRARIKTGTYTGDGVDDRNIDIGVDLSSKNNVCPILQAAVTHYAAYKIELGQGDISQMFSIAGEMANRIQGVTSTGFQLGDDVNVNSNGVVYRYLVFWSEP